MYEKMWEPIVIEGPEYLLCVKHAEDMWANKKTGEWGKGLLNTPEDPHKAERVGTLGEMAFSKHSNLPIDLTYIEGGDQQDFVLVDSTNRTLNIKTAARNYNQALIKVKSSPTGKLIKMKNDVYVFAYIISEIQDAQKATLMLVGWETKEEIEKWPIVPAMKGRHMNYAKKYEWLRPLPTLFPAT